MKQEIKMGDCMPKEQADYIHDVQLYCLDATNMTEQEAYNFAFRCWQLGFAKKKHIIRETKADTVHKMQEMIQERCLKVGIYPAIVARIVDEVAKELIGDEA